MQHGFHGTAIAAAEKQSAVVIVLGQQLKIDSFFSVYGAENILRPRAAPCFFVFFSDRCKENLHRLKKILKQADKQRILILVSCVDRSCCDTGFLGDLVQSGLLEAVSKKFRISSLNDPIIQGMVSIGHVFTPLHLNNNIIIDNGVIITLFFLLVNTNCTLLCKKHSLTNLVSLFDLVHACNSYPFKECPLSPELQRHLFFEYGKGIMKPLRL